MTYQYDTIDKLKAAQDRGAAKALKLPSGDFIEYLLAGKGIYEALKANGFLEEL